MLETYARQIDTMAKTTIKQTRKNNEKKKQLRGEKKRKCRLGTVGSELTAVSGLGRAPSTLLSTKFHP